MYASLRRHWWVVTAATVTASAAFAASAVSHVLEASAFEERPVSLAPAPVRDARAVAPAAPDKDGAELVRRNMFCSSCEPDTHEPGRPAPEPGESGIPLTTLPLELLATNLASRTAWSFATVRNTASSHQGSYWVGDSLPGAGPIRLIGGRSVVFENPASGRLERVALLREGGEGAKRVAQNGALSRPDSPFAEQIRKIDETTFEVDRRLVTDLLARSDSIKGARVRPVQNADESLGLRFYAVARASLPAALGLRSGDVVSAVNGMEFTSPDRLLEIYSKVRELDRLSVTVQRAGKPVTLAYRVL